MAAGDITRRLLRLLPVIAAAAIAALVTAPDDSSLAKARSAARPPVEKQIGLRPGLQLAAMRTAIAAAPSFWDGYETSCSRTVPVIASVKGPTMAGNFRDQQTGCYVWLNLAHAPFLNAQEICKLTLHEMGHLGGHEHANDPDDVMYSPFQSLPIPPPCVSPLPD